MPADTIDVQVNKLEAFKAAKDYPGAYNYMASQIAQMSGWDKNLIGWYTSAARINQTADQSDYYKQFVFHMDIDMSNLLYRQSIGADNGAYGTYASTDPSAHIHPLTWGEVQKVSDDIGRIVLDTYERDIQNGTTITSDQLFQLDMGTAAKEFGMGSDGKWAFAGGPFATQFDFPILWEYAKYPIGFGDWAGVFLRHASTEATWGELGYFANIYAMKGMSKVYPVATETFLTSQWIAQKLASAILPHDPLVIDLNGNGISFVGLSASDAHFDLDGNGFAEHTAWVNPDDGFLVADLNGNGKIDDISEMFGSDSEDGFAALAPYDTNGDGIIDSRDANFSSLEIWRDANGDGVTNAGELMSLADAGIASISLSSTKVSQYTVSGARVTSVGSVTTTDGAVHTAESVWLTTDQTDTRFVVPDGFQMDPETSHLPNIRGYGAVADLNVAMSLDPTLMQMVKDLVANAAADFTGLDSVLGSRHNSSINGVLAGYTLSSFDEMLMRWAGTDGESGNQAIRDTVINITGMTPNSRSDYVGVFHLLSEELAARFYYDVATIQPMRMMNDAATLATDHPPADGVQYSSAEEAQLDQLGFSSLISGAEAIANNPYLSILGSTGYDIASDTFSPDMDAIAGKLSPNLHVDPENPWALYSTWLSSNNSILYVLDHSSSKDAMAIYSAWSGNLAIVDEKGAHVDIDGTTGGDQIYTDMSGIVFNPDGSISFENPDPQIVRGGAGDDFIAISTSTEVTVVVKAGDGNDVVDPGYGSYAPSLNHIVFQGVSATDASYEQVGGDLVIHYSQSDSVTLKHYFEGDYPTADISFPDVMKVDPTFINDQVMYAKATDGDDVITGMPSGTQIVGLGGNDVITGLAGADAIDGGPGDDVIHAGAGDDFISYSAGEGNDMVWGDDGADTLRMVGLSPSDVSVVGLTAIGHHILTGVVLSTSSGSVTLQDQFDGNGVEHVTFADGTNWSSSDLMAMALATDPSLNQGAIVGTANGDVLSGDNGDDIILGYDGNDNIFGGISGEDIIVGGSGDDTIAVYGDHSVVYGGSGNDRIDVQPEAIGTYGVSFDHGEHDITIYAGDGDDFVNGTFGATGMVVDLGAGNDLINASFGYDVIEGGDGDDDIRTYGGHDLVSGGAGNDTVEFIDEDKVDVDLGAGTVRYDGGDPVALTGIENVSGSAHNDHIVGDDGNNNLWGGAGNDTLVGGSGNDFLSGDDGDNVVMAGDGDDAIYGDSFVDNPATHISTNVIDGGDGYDTVYFSRAHTEYSMSTSNGELSISYTGAGDGSVTDTIVGVEGLFFYGDYSYVGIASPIILDMNGDGIHLTDKTQSSVSFDFDGDGVSDKTGWMSAGDGMLVHDANGNGIVDGAGEVTFTNVEGAKSDLDGLKVFDTNHDGVLSNLDTDFGTFGVWVDSNQNGVSDPGEFKSLADLGITSINLSETANNATAGIGENVTIGTGTAQSDHGAIAFSDVAFMYDGSKTLAATDDLPNSEPVGAGAISDHISAMDQLLQSWLNHGAVHEYA